MSRAGRPRRGERALESSVEFKAYYPPADVLFLPGGFIWAMNQIRAGRVVGRKISPRERMYLSAGGYVRIRYGAQAAMAVHSKYAMQCDDWHDYGEAIVEGLDLIAIKKDDINEPT